MKVQRKFYLPNIMKAIDKTRGKYMIENLQDPSIIHMSVKEDESTEQDENQDKAITTT